MTSFVRLLSDKTQDEEVAGKNAPGQDIPKQTPPDATTLPDMDKDIKDATEEMNSICQQVLFAETLEKHKSNPTALIEVGRRQLYLTSSVSSMESLSDAEITVSIENVISDAGEKIKEWVGKALATVKKSILAVKAKLGFAAHGVDETGESAISRLSEPKTLGEKIKAHPYATVAACIASCVALAAIVPMFTSAIPTTMSAEAGTVGISRLIAAVKNIKWPFGSFSLTAAKNSISVAYEATKNTFTAMRTAPIDTIKNLGWTQSLVKGVSSQATKFARLFPRLSELMVSQFKKEVELIKSIPQQPSFFKKVKKTAGAAFRISMYLPFLQMGWSVVTAVFGLIKDIVLGTFRIIKHTFNALAGRGAKVPDDASETQDEEGVLA